MWYKFQNDLTDVIIKVLYESNLFVFYCSTVLRTEQDTETGILYMAWYVDVETETLIFIIKQTFLITVLPLQHPWTSFAIFQSKIKIFAF